MPPLVPRQDIGAIAPLSRFISSRSTPSRLKRVLIILFHPIVLRFHLLEPERRWIRKVRRRT